MIPLTILGGWLGAGKTTLLNRVLAEATDRVAVVVNDVGEVNIDIELIAREDDEIIELTNGCVCCSIGGSLAITLKELAERSPPPDRIIVETSGVADPAAVARYGDRRVVPLDAIVTAVDVTEVERRLVDRTYGSLVRAQIAAADLCVLTKVDLIDSADRNAVVELIASITEAPVVDADVSLGWATAVVAGGVADPGLGETRPGVNPPPVVTALWEPDEPVAIDEVMEVLVAHQSELLRAKGILVGGDGATLVQLAGRRCERTAHPALVDGHGQMVLIAAREDAIRAVMAALTS